MYLTLNPNPNYMMNLTQKFKKAFNFNLDLNSGLNTKIKPEFEREIGVL